MEIFDIKKCVSEICMILADKSDMKQISFKPIYSQFKDYLLKSDQKRFQQVLLNLLSNAIKFTNQGGTIDIVVEYSSESEVRVEVVDRGVGIKE